MALLDSQMSICNQGAPLVGERSTRHTATSGERPQKKHGAQPRTQQSSDADIGSQCNKSHVSKTEEKLRLLLLSLLSSFIGIRPTKPTADCKTHSNLAKTSR